MIDSVQGQVMDRFRDPWNHRPNGPPAPSPSGGVGDGGAPFPNTAGRHFQTLTDVDNRLQGFPKFLFLARKTKEMSGESAGLS